MIRFCITGFVLTWWLFFQMGCRGYSNDKPPVHPNPNMDIQEKGKAYKESDFFENHQYMRPPIEGTIDYEHLNEDEHFYYGKMDNKPATSFPAQIELNEAFLRRGQLVFNRTCAACHGQIGDGNGLVGRRLLVKPTSFHSDYMYQQPPGHFFDAIVNGIRTMPKYRPHIRNTRDIWATVAWIRVLQMSQDSDGEWIKRSAAWWTVK